MSNAVQVSKNEQIKTALKALGPELKNALPPHIPVEKFIRVAQTAILTSPSIIECERNSLFSACMKAAQDGLLPDGKEAALVPFKSKNSPYPVATYMPMVQGILKKIRNSGEMKTITSQIVFEKDSFEYFVDEKGEHLIHRPNIMDPARGEAIGVYAIGETKDGGVYIEVMSREDVRAVMEASRSKGDGPWNGPFWLEMWRKTAIRRLAKRLPMSTDQEEVIQRDDQYYDFNNEPKEEAPKKGEASRLNGLVKKGKKVAPPPETVEAESVSDQEDPEENQGPV